MAAGFNVSKTWKIGDLRFTILEVTGDTSYPAGGYAYSLDTLDLDRVVFSTSDIKGGFSAAYNNATGKVVVYSPTGVTDDPFVELTATTDIATRVITLLLIGTYLSIDDS